MPRRAPSVAPAVRRGPATLALLALALAGCAGGRDPAEWAAVREVTPPFLARARATDAAVAADAHGRVAVTWVTRDPAGGADLWIAVSRDSGLSFATPVRLNRAAGRVSSHAESRPVPVWGPRGLLAVAWAASRADGGHATDVVVSASPDAGDSWGEPVIVNDDAGGVPRYHGFPALACLPGGALVAAWMDGRGHPDEEAESRGSLYTAVSADGGRSWSENVRVSDLLCPCCRAALLPLGGTHVAIAWRSAEHDLRDPVLAFSLDGGRTFTAGGPVSADGWRLEACPSDGPVLAGEGTSGVCVWFTGAEPSGVYLAPWEFGHGVAGLRRVLGDSLQRAAHPRLARLGTATLVALEAQPRGDSGSALAVRALDPDGSLTAWTFLGADARGGWLAAQPPRAAIACWTEGERGAERVRLARITRHARR